MAQVGRTIQHTLTGFLLVSLASPAYDLWRIRRDAPEARLANAAHPGHRWLLSAVTNMVPLPAIIGSVHKPNASVISSGCKYRHDGR